MAAGVWEEEEFGEGGRREGTGEERKDGGRRAAKRGVVMCGLCKMLRSWLLVTLYPLPYSGADPCRSGHSIPVSLLRANHQERGGSKHVPTPPGVKCEQLQLTRQRLVRKLSPVEVHFDAGCGPGSGEVGA